MARIRTLKPEFWTDEKLAVMKPITRLVFLGLISQADDNGRLVDNIKLLDGMLFPYTDDSCADSLTELRAMGRVIRYRSESGQSLIQLTNWDRHQKVKNPSRYTLPAPSTAKVVEPTAETVETPPCDPRSPIPDPLPPTVDPGEGRTDRTALIDEMVTDLTKHAEAEYPDPVKRRSFVAKARGAIAGEDRTVWEDGKGNPAPWEERPRLLRLAFDRMASGDSDTLRGALRWVVPQQLDPDRQRPAIVGQIQARDGPINQPADPVDGLALLKAEQPELYAEVLAEFERYPWWSSPDTTDWFRIEQLRQAMKEKLSKPRIVA